MIPYTLQTVEDATPERLTALLEKTNLLAGRRVKRVRTRGNAAFNSTVAHLELQFDDAHAPHHLLLKLNRDGEGSAEVAFYELAAKSGADIAMLVPCFSATFDAESGASHLLLQDVSATHETPVSREPLLALKGVPTATRLRAVTEALARFHAAFWEHPILDKQPATWLTQLYRDRVTFEKSWAEKRQDYETFVQAHGHRVSTEVHRLYEGALEHHALLWERYLEPRTRALTGLTLTHNDCYLTQFLCPKQGRGDTHLIDFQTVGANFAARDLVFLLATFWTREQRLKRERGVLEHYHHTLLQHGVKDYSLQNLFEDYRLMLIEMIFYPVWDTTYGAAPDYWQPKLRCLTDAYSDWQCNALVY